ncbi:DUF4037 domain-containing protein [Crossiella sp. SN42]|uniref:DUF4037 domain-containing protein n=1 Tax=Crossiella sp. SN42 TaxID=2944808 RepID=UPI00273A5DDC|nr:DUF4037 domain-containing protein [Crossiella sp. SN42]
MDSAFVPGLELSRRYYWEVVEPLLRRHFGDLPHTAARIGSGSEVLGFDTERSADHEWGPRLQLFLDAQDGRRFGESIRVMLAERLPKEFLGFPTHFESTEDQGVGVMRLTEGTVNHRVEVSGLGDWFGRMLGFDPRVAVSTGDWLVTPTQTLAEITAGAVFHDGLAEHSGAGGERADRADPVQLGADRRSAESAWAGDLGRARERLRWYPAQVWRFVLARQWGRVAEEEAFVGRCGEVGDEVGSAVVAARVVRDLMRLCLLMGRRYPPYGKWLGSAFGRLPVAAELAPVFREVLAARDWREREAGLVRAYEVVAGEHNRLGLTEVVDPAVRGYHSRPFRVLRADRFSAALLATVTDPGLRGPGAVDQWADSTALLTDRELSRRVGWSAIT